ncbi:MAG: formylglycine-generating enzyme family protein [Planctomycetota bacterium]
MPTITTRLATYLCLAITCPATFAAESLVAAEQRLVKQRPSEGRFVETDQGFMVPYTQRLPGSNAIIEMVPVPGGRITLGKLPPLPDDARAEKVTSRLPGKSMTVAIEPYWMSKYEITMEQFMPYRELYYKHKRDRDNDKLLETLKIDSVDAVTGPTEVYEPNYNFEHATKPKSPVPTVTQFGARQYTKWLSLLTGEMYRLPFRSEWQHACRAGTKTAYSFGDEIARLKEYAVYWDEANESHADNELDVLLVGTKKPNPWGLFDMHGNVAEWVIEDSAVTGLIEGHVACGGSWCFLESTNCRWDALIRSDEGWWDEDPDFPRSCWWMTSEDSRGTGFRILSPLAPPTLKDKRSYWEVDSESLRLDVQSRIDGGRGSLGPVLR